jgi:hypothetical protein
MRSLSAAFQTWHVEVQEQRQHRMVASKVVSRLAHCKLAAAVSTWRASFTEAARIRGLLNRAASRIMNRALSSAFQQWRFFIHELHRRMAILGRTVQRMRKGSLSRSFLTWVQFVMASKLRKQSSLLMVAATSESQLASLGVFAGSLHQMARRVHMVLRDEDRTWNLRVDMESCLGVNEERTQFFLSQDLRCVEESDVTKERTLFQKCDLAPITYPHCPFAHFSSLLVYDLQALALGL